MSDVIMCNTPDVTVRYLSGDEVLLSQCKSVWDVKVQVALRHEDVLCTDVVVLDPVSTRELEADSAPLSNMAVVLVSHREYDDSLYVKALLKHANSDISRVMDRIAHNDADQCALPARALFEYVQGSPPMEGKVAKHLVCAGANLDCKTTSGQNALIIASENNYGDVVRVLVESPELAPCVNEKSECGMAALHEAAYGGHTEVVQMLLAAHADVHAADAIGDRALHWAACKGRVEVVRMLMKAGADVNAQNLDGATALHLACYKGQAEVVRALLEHADVNMRNVEGRTACEVAARFKRTNIVALFSEN